MIEHLSQKITTILLKMSGGIHFCGVNSKLRSKYLKDHIG